MRGNDLDSVKDGFPETPVAPSCMGFDFVERCQM